jgi:hypothetical protein
LESLHKGTIDSSPTWDMQGRTGRFCYVVLCRYVSIVRSPYQNVWRIRRFKVNYRGQKASYFEFSISFQALGLRIPVILVHLLLPRDHTYAPVPGSVSFLAVLLKLEGGGQGIWFIACFPYLRSFLWCWGSFGFLVDLYNRLCGYWWEFLATYPEVRVRFPALPDFLRSSWSGTGSTQPREYNREATWKKK